MTDYLVAAGYFALAFYGAFCLLRALARHIDERCRCRIEAQRSAALAQVVVAALHEKNEMRAVFTASLALAQYREMHRGIEARA